MLLCVSSSPERRIKLISAEGVDQTVGPFPFSGRVQEAGEDLQFVPTHERS